MFKRRPKTGPDTIVAINKDLARAAKRSGGEVLEISQLRKGNRYYPHLIPTLLEWVVELEQRADLQPVPLAGIYNALFRSLTTEEAPPAEVTKLALDYLDSHPQAGSTVIAGAGNAASFHASAEDMDRMLVTGTDRYLGEGRAFVLEWLVLSKDDHAITTAAGELDDPSVRVGLLKVLARLKKWPDGVREIVDTVDVTTDKRLPKLRDRLLAKIDKAASTDKPS